MNKKQTSLIAVYVIIFAVYSVLFFLLPIPKGGAGWIAYLFAVISIGVAAVVSYFVFGKENGIISKFYGFPIFKIGNLYALIQLLFGLLITMVGAVVKIPMWIVFVVSIVLLGAVAIGLIATANTKKIVENQEKETERKTKSMTFFRLDMENVMESCIDDKLKKQLEDLVEKFRYSDPVSSEELVEIETKIKNEVELLGELVVNDQEAAMKQIVRVNNLLADRNRRCKSLKK